MHLLGDLPVGGMALWCGAQLQDVHGFAGIHVHQVANPVGQSHGVRRLLREWSAEGIVQVAGPLHRGVEPASYASLVHLRRADESVVAGEPLPVQRQHPVPLHIPEGAIVGEDVESVRRTL